MLETTASPAVRAMYAADGDLLRDEAARGAIRMTGIQTAMKQPLIPLTVLSGDRLLCRLAAFRDSIAIPMARAAFAINEREAWTACGYRNVFDFTRERLDRDQRWLQDLVRLHETLEKHPAIATALSGIDGGPLLGQMAAIQIGRVSKDSDVGAWIERARNMSFAALRTEVARQLAHGKSEHASSARQEALGQGAPPASAPATSSETPSLEDEMDTPRVPVRQMVPPDIKIIFDDVLEHHRAVAGYDAGPAAFVEALGAEVASSGVALPEDYHPRLSPNATKHRPGQIWNHLGAGVSAKRASEDLGTGLGPISELASASSRRAHRHLTESAEVQARLARLERKLAIEFGGTSQAGNSDSDGIGATAEDQLTIEAGGGKMHTDRAELGPGFEVSDGVADTSADGFTARSRVLSWSRKRDLKRLAGVLESLIRLQNTIEMDIADLLLELDEHQAWKWLGFDDLEHYAEEHLGMGRSTARKRVWLARSLRHRSEIRAAFDDGVLGLVATQCAVVVLRDARPDAALQRLWIENARNRTVKGLQDDIRLIKRNHLLRCVEVARGLTPDLAPRFPGPEAADSTSAPRFPDREAADAAADQNAPRFPGQPPDPRAPHHFAPPSDAEWRASLRFGPGQTFDSVFSLGYGLLERVVHRGPLMEVPLTFHLPEAEASTFLRSIEAARRVLVERVQNSSAPGDQSRFTPAARIAQHHVHHGERVPSWVGLLALLEEWVMVHDALKSDGTRPVLRRDRYRCMAPGCTARVNVQVHHLEYRGWGGDNAPENLLVLCAFHHLQGEHGGLARVRGRSP
ncbi:MAG TPA: HNH endonuclease signature motif containing protein, partial [Candidatus Krumholzibacteria bacterium]|nr:HNH endonuclease signature motif containing protein [Candidatus Krumholzibacteria bacterium]